MSAGCIDLIAAPPEAPTSETRAEKEERDAFVESLVGLDSVVCNALLKESGVLDPSERVKALKHLERVKALKEQELEVSKTNSGLLRVEKRKASNVSELPLVNVLTALVAGGAPSRETVKDLLDVLGIVGGLMLSIAVGPPLSLDVEAYEQIVDRFDKPPYDDCGFDGADLIKRFNFHCANAYSANAAALFSTLVVYVCFVTAGDDWYGKEWKAYWNCMRLPIILALLISVVGCLDTIMAVKHYMIMTMPNPRVEHDRHCRGTTFQMRAIWRTPIRGATTTSSRPGRSSRSSACRSSPCPSRRRGSTARTSAADLCGAWLAPRAPRPGPARTCPRDPSVLGTATRNRDRA